ncbi:MAG: prenyltransferase/squalene oxidase repeat-containing protein [Planctomycetota bacterium]
MDEPTTTRRGCGAEHGGRRRLRAVSTRIAAAALLGVTAAGLGSNGAGDASAVSPAAGSSAASSAAPASAPLAQRGGRGREGRSAQGVPITPAQEEATAKGLAWLAREQNDDGSWTGDVGYKLNSTYQVDRREQPHVGVTALCGMAFLAGGHLPGRGEYGETLDKTIDFVLGCVDNDGYITRSDTRMYSHAFATLFLAEAYGMTYRQDLRLKLQKAVDFIVKCQNDEGGWRYEPLARDSDISIVVCQCLALRAARNIGIRVPKSTVDQAIRYVVSSANKGDAPLRRSADRDSSPGTFRYQPQIYSRTEFALTAAGVTALNGLGIYSDQLIDLGIDYLNSQFFAFNQRHGHRGHYFFWYGHYYAVQAMYTRGGSDWVNYFTKLRSFLVGHQQADGSWPNNQGPGLAFSTAMGCLILEIPYDFLPIFHR